MSPAGRQVGARRGGDEATLVATGLHISRDVVWWLLAQTPKARRTIGGEDAHGERLLGQLGRVVHLHASKGDIQLQAGPGHHSAGVVSTLAGVVSSRCAEHTDTGSAPTHMHPITIQPAPSRRKLKFPSSLKWNLQVARESGAAGGGGSGDRW